MGLATNEIKKTKQTKLNDEVTERNGNGQTTNFVNNISLPIHGWFRYSAGFSAEWVRDVITQQKKKGRVNVLDPFAGSGTTLLEAEYCGVNSYGVEAHPFVFRVAQAKLCWREKPSELEKHANDIIKKASECRPDISHYPEIIYRCYPEDSLKQLDRIKRAWIETNDSSPSSKLTWLAMVSILRQCSPVGTANWQYLLPKKSKAKYLEPFEAFRTKIATMARDMELLADKRKNPVATIAQEDARNIVSVPENWADLVITSPPYANNYDYADATRLEMTFLGEIKSWGDLQNTVRSHLVRSCTQHVGPIAKNTLDILSSPVLEPIREEITEICNRLETERELHGGKKQYHTMIAAYFKDMAETWISLRRITAKDSIVCFVIGDSAPYGVHVPVDRWMGELAVAAGFESFTFEKIRDRNIKWKNRKHTVPLHEGNLWVKG